MRLIHLGVTVDIPDTDVRVAMIEALVFSRALPGPLTVVLPQDVPEEPVEIPDPVRAFWKKLSVLARRELALLAERRYWAPELESALGVSKTRLSGVHSSISRAARTHRVAIGIRRIGRVRADRRYELMGDHACFVPLLAKGMKAESSGRKKSLPPGETS